MENSDLLLREIVQPVCEWVSFSISTYLLLINNVTSLAEAYCK
jgi:hypothetical protein